MAKKTALVLCVLILFGLFSSCSSQSDGTEQVTEAVSKRESYIPEDDSTFKLSYTQSDSLNPFDSITQNNQVLAQLVFESLFDLDDNFSATLNIASGYRYTDADVLEVTLNEGLKFSDGSALTAQDVEYSFEKAAKSPYWGNSLVGISSCRAETDAVAVFNLRYPNSYAHNLLVFPIISSEDDENGNPVGSGRYYFAIENGETVLKARKSDSFKPYITTIHLENITTSESVDNAVNIGNISFAFRDLSRDSSRKITADKKLVNMNNLVFIGINNKSSITSNQYIRKAISLAVDREMLVKSAFGGFALAAETVFNPKSELSSTKIFTKTADVNAAKQAITQSGAENLSLSLLVNSDNADRVACARLVKQQLEAAGFSVNLFEADSFDKYSQLVKSERFDLYIGEIKLPPDMSLASFFTETGDSHYGINVSESSAAQTYMKYMSGETEQGDFLLAFTGETPYVPLLYRRAMICYSKAMNGDMQGTAYDCFSNIEDWYFKTQ